MSAERQTLLDYAISEARAGRHAQAAEVLWQMVAEDPGNAQAWLWLSGVVAEPAEQRAALERVLALDPRNAPARHGIEWLQAHHPELWLPDAQTTPASAAPVDGAARLQDAQVVAPSDPATQVLPASFDADTRPMEATPTTMDADAGDAPAAPAPQEFPPEAAETVVAPAGAPAGEHVIADEELRCPDCGEWAAATDTHCPRCQTSLIVPRRPSAWARVARWTMALLWLLSAAAAVLGSVALLRISQQLQAGGGSPALQFNSLLFAVTPDVLMGTVNGAGLALGGVALLGVLMALGLLARWRPVYVLHTLFVLLALAAAVGLVVFALPVLDELFRQDPTSATALVAGVLGLPLVQLLLALMARRDFFPRRERVRLPAVARTPEEHWKLGSSYQQRGWRWAAAGEFERAAELEPHTLRYRRALADIYTSMGDHGRAREELRASLNLQPHTSPASRAGSVAEEVQRERQ